MSLPHQDSRSSRPMPARLCTGSCGAEGSASGDDAPCTRALAVTSPGVGHPKDVDGPSILGCWGWWAGGVLPCAGGQHRSQEHQGGKFSEVPLMRGSQEGRSLNPTALNPRLESRSQTLVKRRLVPVGDAPKGRQRGAIPDRAVIRFSWLRGRAHRLTKCFY